MNKKIEKFAKRLYAEEEFSDMKTCREFVKEIYNLGKEEEKGNSIILVKEFKDKLIDISLTNKHLIGAVTSNQILETEKTFWAETHNLGKEEGKECVDCGLGKQLPYTGSIEKLNNLPPLPKKISEDWINIKYNAIPEAINYLIDCMEAIYKINKK